MARNGLITICSFVAPSEEVRQRARESVGDDLLIVHVDAPVEVCRERNHAFYEAAEEEGLETIPGVNLPYEAPENPDVTLTTDTLSIEDSVERLMALLEEKGAF